MEDAGDANTTRDAGRLSRRRLLAAAGVGGVGLGLAAGGLELANDTGQGRSADTVPFYGAHQAGIATEAQSSLHFAAFDFTSTAAGDLRDLLRSWSEAAARMTAGELLSPSLSRPSSLALDTGEAKGSGPTALTITIGLGPGLFERHGKDRLGLLAQKPAALEDIPPLPGDELEPGRSGGDLCVQACANDPQVAFHAVHNLALIAHGTAVMRWSQLGFGRTATTSRRQTTPRILLGFKDGTNNIRAEDEAAMNEHVWARRADGPGWMEGGTYMVARRIRMLLDVWDSTSVPEQERVIGRYKDSGAPLGRTHEDDPVDLDARASGAPVIPVDAHIRLTSPRSNAGVRILRRGYSFTDGVDPDTSQIDAGLFFICFQRDPRRQFTAIQRRLGVDDALSHHISHTSSAVFACPPGARPGGYVGETLFRTV
jgi:deferrochelatase/peroxidase EfeB